MGNKKMRLFVEVNERYLEAIMVMVEDRLTFIESLLSYTDRHRDYSKELRILKQIKAVIDDNKIQ